MKLVSVSDIGVKRKDNQDNYWSALATIDGADAGFLCVCDGMGGLNNGGLASQIVVDSVRVAIKSGIAFKELEDVIKQANKTVYELGLESNARMGTTCTVLQCYGGVYEIFHVGDSRCYKLSESDLYSEPLTIDHSAVKQYNITKEKEPDLYQKYKSSLTRCLGVKPEVSVDYITGSYSDGDIFLVCSDGMWHFLEGKTYTIADIQDIEGMPKKCISCGETDNITGCVLSV